MSKIIHIDNGENTSWNVYLTPIGADTESGDEDEFVEAFGSLSEAALVLLDALAKQDRERIEHNAEEIAAYERHIKEQKSELSVSDCKWEKAEAAARALLLAKAALIYGDLSEQLEKAGIGFKVLEQIHEDKERGR